MGLFTEIGILDSILIMVFSWMTYAVIGSVIFSAIDTPWEYKDEWYYVVARELFRVLVGFFAAYLSLCAS